MVLRPGAGEESADLFDGDNRSLRRRIPARVRCGGSGSQASTVGYKPDTIKKNPEPGAIGPVTGKFPANRISDPAELRGAGWTDVHIAVSHLREVFHH